MTPHNLETAIKERTFGVDSRDLITDISVSVQLVPHIHDHEKLGLMEYGYYVGIDVFSKASGSIFSRLRQEYNYGPATISSHGNGFSCNKRLLNRHSPNAFIPYCRLPGPISHAYLSSLESRLHSSGCQNLREYASAVFQTENARAPEDETDEKEAFTELDEFSLGRNIKYNTISVTHVH